MSKVERQARLWSLCLLELHAHHVRQHILVHEIFSLKENPVGFFSLLLSHWLKNQLMSGY